jgi:hypothetical protein
MEVGFTLIAYCFCAKVGGFAAESFCKTRVAMFPPQSHLENPPLTTIPVTVDSFFGMKLQSQLSSVGAFFLRLT